MATISLDYAKVIVEINRLKTISNELHTLQTNVQNAMNDMNSYWEGAAAKEFLAVSDNWRKEVKSIEVEILDIANLIRKVADEIKLAEERATAAIARF